MNWLAISAAGEIRLGYCSPMSAHLKNRDHVICIVIGFEIEQKWRITQDTECSGGEDCALQAMRSLLAQDYARGPGCSSKMVGELIKETLHADRILESTELAELGGRKHQSKCVLE